MPGLNVDSVSVGGAAGKRIGAASAQVAGLLAILFPVAASASEPDLSDPRIDRAIACILRSHGDASSQLAASPPGSAEEAAANAALEMPVRRCLVRNRVADSADFRSIMAGRIAEQLYRGSVMAFGLRRDSTGSGKASSESVTVPGRSVTVPAGSIPGLVERANARASEESTTYTVAWCAVHRAPEDIDRLVRTVARSNEEREAFDVVAPVFAACLDIGQQLAGSRSLLRAELARALYRYMAPHDYP